MRLFCAVKIDENAKSLTASLQKQFRQVSLCGSFTQKDNYHITIKFFGEQSPDYEKIISASLKKIAEKFSSFKISSGNPGIFRRKDGSVLWLGIDEGKEKLWEIFSATEEEFTGKGFPCEKSSYNPHITLGRRVKFKGEFKHLAEDMEITQFECCAEGLSLFESTRKNGLLFYKELFFFPFEEKCL